VGRGGDPRRVGDGANRVRGEREGNHPRALADQLLEGVLVERHVALVDGRRAHDQIVIPRHQQPGRHVRVVVELGDDDLVAGLQRACDRMGELEVERGHVRPEGDPLGRGAREVGGGRPRARHDLVRRRGRGERAA
jgi:hypothetical protein